jgi:hypothetical protein
MDAQFRIPERLAAAALVALERDFLWQIDENDVSEMAVLAHYGSHYGVDTPSGVLEAVLRDGLLNLVAIESYIERGSRDLVVIAFETQCAAEFTLMDLKVLSPYISPTEFILVQDGSADGLPDFEFQATFDGAAMSVLERRVGTKRWRKSIV